MNILFMCVANSARSQLAEGWAKEIFPNARIYSAGSHPRQLNPFAVRVMSEVGIDISTQFSKSYHDLESEFINSLDYLITLCAEEVCPILVSKAKKFHWPFPDPATNDLLPESEMLQRFRDARDAICARLKSFKEELDR